MSVLDGLAMSLGYAVMVYLSACAAVRVAEIIARHLSRYDRYRDP